MTELELKLVAGLGGLCVIGFIVFKYYILEKIT